MANYTIDPAILKQYIPRQTELDIYNGNVYVSLVGFMFEKTKLLGLSIPFHKNFEEVNLRFYVRYRDEGQWKRGTVFIKELVPKPAISIVANTVYHEKYSTLPMNHFINKTATALHLGYQWKHKGKWNTLEASTSADAAPMQPGSLEEFIAEHYWGYSKYNEEVTYEYHVQHPAWEVYPVNNYKVDCDFAALYGQPFAVLEQTSPGSVFVAKGSPVSVLKKKRLPH